MIEPVEQADLASTLESSTVIGLRAEEPDPTGGNFARVRLADGPLAGAVLGRVVAMMLARADWPLDRLDDARLICDALSAHASAHAGNATMTVSIEVDESEAELRVLDLTDEGAARLSQDAMLPIVGNVLERIAERVSVELGPHGEGSELVLALRARAPRLA
ncbi:MAG TPA: hypothetical protein VGL79_07375 [Solirubrobacteraceae bacterium]|jgi:serine/threonine-protein kinase RsbW